MQIMLERKLQVLCLTPDGDEASDQDLLNLGVTVRHYFLEPKGLNPLADCRTYLELKRIFIQEKPDLLFATTIKPVIYGCLAASAASICGIYAVITGLGYAFETDSLFKKLLNALTIKLYRSALKNATAIFFQNKDDLCLFDNNKIIPKTAHIFMANGTGVDISRFAPEPLPPEPLTFILPARLLQAKGVPEFAKAAQILKANYPDVRFQILGPLEKGRGGVPEEQIRAWVKKGTLEWPGEARDVRPYLAKSHVIVLPSWREGFPTVLMEAMSMGRPCIAANVPGCNAVVEDGINGLLCPAHEPEALALAMKKFLDNPASLQPMAQNARLTAEQRFDSSQVAQGIFQDMASVYPCPERWQESLND